MAAGDRASLDAVVGFLGIVSEPAIGYSGAAAGPASTSRSGGARSMVNRYLSQGFAAGLAFAVIAVIACRRIDRQRVRWGVLAAISFAAFVWAAVDLDDTVGYFRHLPDLGILWPRVGPPLAVAAVLPLIAGEAAYRWRVRRTRDGNSPAEDRRNSG